jgi:hypothetical protein
VCDAVFLAAGDGAVELGQQVRREEADRFDHQGRWFTRIVVPLGGLLIGVIG